MTPRGSTEREIKLTVAAGGPGGPGALFDHLARLPALGAAYALGPARAISIRDVYYDTADRRLGQARVALRVRVQDGRVLLTVKRSILRDGPLAEREEYEAPLCEESLRQALTPLGHLLDPTALSPAALQTGQPTGPLVPVLVAATRRREREVAAAGTGPGSPVVALLSLDRVEYESVPGRPVYLDVEVEAVPGTTVADLQAIADLLVRVAGEAGGRLVPETESKLSRGLRLATAGPAARADPPPGPPTASTHSAPALALRADLLRAESP